VFSATFSAFVYTQIIYTSMSTYRVPLHSILSALEIVDVAHEVKHNI